MTIVACPRCRDEVALPEHAHPQSIVRCPLCGEDYPLASALAAAPPVLTVVSPAPTAADEVGEYRFAPVIEAPRPLVLEERAAGMRVPAKPVRRGARRAERNPFVEIVKIVAGGVVGLTIGQLVLWWMPGDWSLAQRDPLRIGQQLAPHVPWIVSPAVRGTAEGTAPGAEASSGKSATSGPTPQVALPRASDRRTLPPVNNAPRTTIRAEEQALPTFGDSDQPGRRERPAAPRGSGEAGDRGGSSGSPGAVEEPVGFRNATPVSAGELSAMLAAAQLVWEQSDSEDRMQRLHETLTELAYDVVFVDPRDEETPGAVAAVRTWLGEVLRGENVVNELARLAAAPRSAADGGTRGCVVAGTVAQIDAVGRLYASRLNPIAGAPHNVVSTVDPQEVFGVGDRVFLLGIHVADPQTQLAGYDGERSAVVFGGLALKLASAGPSSAPDDASPPPAKPPEAAPAGEPETPPAP